MISEVPIVGITMGDAAGIGPEIVLKALEDKTLKEACRCVIIGDASFLRKTANELASTFKLTVFGDESANKIEVFDLNNLPDKFPIGIDAALTGKASAENIEAAVKLWRDGKIDAICTAPISKKAIHLGGYDFPGHTEFLADLTDTKDFRMSFFAEGLRTVLLSTHLPILRAIDLIKKDSLIDLIAFTDREMSKLLGRKVSIAVAGLNPHASEGGMFGSEEAAEITPAIEHCRNILGIEASGPYSPDTIFLRGFKGDFDAVIALYHDQATIAVKSLSFGTGVNVTLGLQVIRTSVDHGTAFDIAGKGIAEASSMISAIKLAGELVKGSQNDSKV
ncbi:MAG TPA: 4-hydroxythreonine-4-phosphate dehydrogenase PdxA [Pyrinomonadaceae bacterium]|nr:4-hydroxythreonine-4-phosphate dehydrogenase PdxA [Pyrinomonadaceae bacterium]